MNDTLKNINNFIIKYNVVAISIDIINVLIPIAIGISTYILSAKKIDPTALWLLIILCIFAAIFAILKAIINWSSTYLVADSLKYMNTISINKYLKSEIDNIIEFTKAEVVIAQRLNEFIVNSKDTTDNDADLNQNIKFIIGYTGEQLKSWFGREGDEYFTIALYLYDKDVDILKCKFKWNDPTLKSDEIGRDWKSGQGAVGHCFMTKEYGRYNNIMTSCIHVPDNLKKHYDNDTYVSIVTLPIFVKNAQNPEDNILRGVLCITSNKENCFEREEDNDLNEKVSEISRLKFHKLCLISYLISINYNQVFKEN